jgi:hypothetical protein
MGKIIVAFASVGAVLFAAYIGDVAWEGHRLEQLCTDVRAGSPTDSVAALAQAYGFKRTVTARLEDGVDVWETLVVASSTMGEDSCRIRYNKDVVLSSELHQD